MDPFFRHDFDLDNLDDDRLPNGHTRQEYFDLGFSDSDIGFWGLDQPGAPGPEAAGFVIMDMMEENDWDGEPDF